MAVLETAVLPLHHWHIKLGGAVDVRSTRSREVVHYAQSPFPLLTR